MNDLSVSVSTSTGSVPPAALPDAPAKVTAFGLNFYYGEHHALKNINLVLGANASPPSSGRPVAASRPCCGSSTGCTTSIPASAPPGN
jgi:hypothetical protein